MNVSRWHNKFLFSSTCRPLIPPKSMLLSPVLASSSMKLHSLSIADLTSCSCRQSCHEPEPTQKLPGAEESAEQGREEEGEEDRPEVERLDEQRSELASTSCPRKSSWAG